MSTVLLCCRAFKRLIWWLMGSQKGLKRIGGSEVVLTFFISRFLCLHHAHIVPLMSSNEEKKPLPKVPEGEGIKEKAKSSRKRHVTKRDSSVPSRRGQGSASPSTSPTTEREKKRQSEKTSIIETSVRDDTYHVSSKELQSSRYVHQVCTRGVSLWPSSADVLLLQCHFGQGVNQQRESERRHSFLLTQGLSLSPPKREKLNLVKVFEVHGKAVALIRSFIVDEIEHQCVYYTLLHQPLSLTPLLCFTITCNMCNSHEY